MKSLCMFIELEFEWIRRILFQFDTIYFLHWVYISVPKSLHNFSANVIVLQNIFLLFIAFLLRFLRGTFSTYRSFILKICFFLLLKLETVCAYYHRHSVVLNIISCNLSKLTFRKLQTHRFWREKNVCSMLGPNPKAEILWLSRLGQTQSRHAVVVFLGSGQTQSRHAVDVF
jgi:hypothetical protein